MIASVYLLESPLTSSIARQDSFTLQSCEEALILGNV